MHEPVFDAKTVQTAVQWQSPDKQRTIYEIVLERPDGKKHKLKTFSDDIAKSGWNGKVQAYERQGKFGAETYVKQAPKEEGQFKAAPGVSPQATYTPNDNAKSFYYAYAKDVVVALIEAGEVKDPDTATDMIIHVGDNLHAAATTTGNPVNEPTQEDLDTLKDVFPETHGEEYAEDGNAQYDPLFS